MSALDNPTGVSILDEVRRKREDIARNTSTRIALPGYEGKLVAEYRVLTSKEVARFGRLIQKKFKNEGDQMLFSTVDSLIEGCTGIYAVDNEGVEHHIADGYDVTLAQFFQFPADTARQVVLGVFAGREAAVLAHGQDYSNWLTLTNQDTDEELLGESEGTNS